MEEPQHEQSQALPGAIETGHLREPQDLPPLESTGRLLDAPMSLDARPIRFIAYAALTCVATGYIGLLVKVLWFAAQENGVILAFALHAVCMFGLLFKYFGGSLRVTTTSAETK